MDPNLVLQITGLCKDLDYLSEMKRLENVMDQQAQSDSTTQLALTHVVPVSGLFMSCFYRLENELKTVIELWSDPNDLALRERRTIIQNTQPVVKGSRIGIGGASKFRRRRVNTDKSSSLHIGMQRMRTVSALETSTPTTPKEEDIDDLDEDPAPPVSSAAERAPVPELPPATFREVAAAEEPPEASQTTEVSLSSLELVVQVYPNGDRYEGQYLMGKRHGKGEYRFSTGDMYEGQHERGQFKGVGVYKYVNGDHYSGQFCGGMFEGQGVLTTSEFKYMGQFVKDQMCGRGIMVYVNGDRYVGDFKNDLRHGKGTFTAADGSRYDGGWEEDLRHGWGVLLSPEGVRTEGTWYQDQLQGSVPEEKEKEEEQPVP